MRSMLCAVLLNILFAAAAPAAALPSFQAAFPGRDPALQWDAAGNLHVVYIEEQGEEAAVWYRRLGASPAGPVRVSPPGAKVNTSGNAPPVLAILRDGLLVTAYPVSLPGHWKSEIRVQRSTDRGVSWSAGILAHPPSMGAHSYLSAAVTPAGLLTLAWLDNSSGHMGVQSATTSDGLTLSPRQTVDGSTCECCDTALLAGRGGSVWLAYRDLQQGEGEDVRDFRVVRSTAPPLFDGGTKLSNDGWRLKGCPDTGARLAEAADGTLWAAWFTGGGQTGIYVTSSRDGGASFAPRTLVTPAKGLYRHPEIGALPGNRTAVVYEGVNTEGAYPGHPRRARLRNPRTGAWSAARRVAPQGVFPRLAVAGERGALAFTCRAGQQTRVVVADWQLLGNGGLPWAGCDLQ
jgi:hypothetical protein